MGAGVGVGVGVGVGQHHELHEVKEVDPNKVREVAQADVVLQCGEGLGLGLGLGLGFGLGLGV